MTRVLRRAPLPKPFSTVIVPGLRTSLKYWEEFNHLPHENVYMFNYDSKGTVRNALSFFRNRTWLSRLRKSKRSKQVADMIGKFLDQMKVKDPRSFLLVYCHSHGCVITHRALEILAKRYGKRLPIKVIALAPPMFIPKSFDAFTLRGAINYINEQDWIWNLHTRTKRTRTGFTVEGLKPLLDHVPRDRPFLLHAGSKRRTVILIRSRNRIPVEFRTPAKSHYLSAYVDIRSNPKRVMMSVPETVVKNTGKPHGVVNAPTRKRQRNEPSAAASSKRVRPALQEQTQDASSRRLPSAPQKRTRHASSRRVPSAPQKQTRHASSRRVQVPRPVRGGVQKRRRTTALAS